MMFTSCFQPRCVDDRGSITLICTKRTHHMTGLLNPQYLTHFLGHKPRVVVPVWVRRPKSVRLTKLLRGCALYAPPFHRYQEVQEMIWDSWVQESCTSHWPLRIGNGIKYRRLQQAGPEARYCHSNLEKGRSADDMNHEKEWIHNRLITLRIFVL